MKAKIQLFNGVPTLFVDGKPHPAFAYMTFDLNQKFVKAFAEAGIDIFMFSTTSDYDYIRVSADAWLGPDEYDYSWFEQRMQAILKVSPDAKILPRIYLCSPPWWDQSHPEELMVGKNGIYEPKFDFGWLPSSVSEASKGPKKATVPSFSSQVWLQDSGRALQRFLRWSEERYGHCTIGYHICSGGTQEWYYWGAFESTFPDMSVPQQRAFRQWLSARGYPGAEGVAVPGESERMAAEFGTFRDPTDAAASLAIEYWRFHSEAVVEAIAHFVRLTKEIIGSDKLIGVFYAYFVDLCRRPTSWHNSGHLAFRKLIQNPDIDFLSSPTAYKDRRMGKGFSIFNSLTESITQHGKIWWNENDILTDQAPELKDPLFLHPKTGNESRHLQRREFANVLGHGAGTWWFDMWGGYYDDEAHMEDVRRMISIGRRSVHFDRSPIAEVAVVLDDESIYYTECTNRLSSPLIADQLIEMGHIGTPFSVIHADDLLTARKHHFYIFLDLFYMPKERLKLFEQFMKTPDKTCLFVYAPGLVAESLSVARMEQMTGLHLCVDEKASPIRVVTDAPGLPSLEYGISENLSPVVYCDDRHVEVLGNIARTRRAGLVRKTMGDSAVIFSSAPCLPSILLRSLLKQADVHLFTDGGESVYANESFLAVCSMPGRQVRLTLPKPEALYDLFEEKELDFPDKGDHLPESVDGTWVFFRGKRDQWQSAGDMK